MEKLIFNRKVLTVFYFITGLVYLAIYFSASSLGHFGLPIVVGGVHLLVTAIAFWRHRGHKDLVLFGGLASGGLAVMLPMTVPEGQTVSTIFLVISALFAWGFLLSACWPCLRRVKIW